MKEERLEVRSYFREDRVVGTERCSSEFEARNFAKHQRGLFPIVKIVRVLVDVSDWGETILRTDLLRTY